MVLRGRGPLRMCTLPCYNPTWKIMRTGDMILSILHPRLILGLALRPTQIALLYLLLPKTQIIMAAPAALVLAPLRPPCLLLLLLRQIMLRTRLPG